MTRPDRAASERLGRRAERIAAWWLMAHGWRIVDRRRQMPMIEIDLLARRGGVLALVEVKRRATIEGAILALRPDAVRRLHQAAHQLAGEANARGRRLSARVDLIALAPGRLPRHIRDVR